jgi:hypothetical protein
MAVSIAPGLIDYNGSLLVNLSNLHWCWFDGTDFSAIAAGPSVQGTTGSTNSSGVLGLTLTGSTLTSGQSGTLLVETSDSARVASLQLAVS